MGPRSTRGALVFLLLAVMAVRGNDYIPPRASGCPGTVSMSERLASPAPIPSPNSKPDIRNRVVLSIANGFSLALSLSPLFIRWVYGSWFITREIFPAKGVACNLVASATWTVYVMFQMYANQNYAGEDVLLINSVTITSSVGVLLIYFLNDKEHKKFWILMIIFIVMVCCGMGWLVWHPDMIVSQRRQKLLMKSSKYLGITGITLFALVNTLPFSDLWAMTRGDRTDLTLLMPMMINTFLGCLASALWALYAWVFDPIHPNYFMIANSVAAGLAFLQVLWLLVLRILHREVVGQITDVESLRSVFLSVSRSLKRLAATPSTTWTRDYLLELQGNVDIGWQALLLMERTFTRLEAELVVKADLLAAAAATATAATIEAGGNAAPATNQVDSSKAVAAEATAKASLALCQSFLGLCRSNMIALDNMKKAAKDKVSYDDKPPAWQAEQAEQDQQQPWLNLQASITVVSTATKELADHLRSSIQIINASEGIPSTDVVLSVPGGVWAVCRERISGNNA